MNNPHSAIRISPVESLWAERQLKAFTLVELLVVIAIISLLANLLMPSLIKARDAARTAVCLSNQRQFGCAAVMYIDEFSGFLPPVQDQPSPNTWLFFQEDGSLGRYLYPELEITVENYSPLRCPSYTNESGSRDPPYGSPMMNLNVDICFFRSWGWACIYRKASSIVSPGRVVLMRDMEGSDLDWASFWCTGYYTCYESYMEQYARYNHDDGFVALFLDGHVSWQKEVPNTYETWGWSP